MLKLYVKTGCPYCAAVIAKLNNLGIPYEEANIADQKVAEELIVHGGKRQVPYMEDEDPCKTAEHHTPCLIDGDIHMYESEDIITYLEENYA
jgi:glutaredoxin